MLKLMYQLTKNLITSCSVTMMLFLHFFFFSSRRRHTRFDCDWSSDVCSSDLNTGKMIEVNALSSEAEFKRRAAETYNQYVTQYKSRFKWLRDRKSVV